MPSKRATLTGMRKREELTAWLFISPIVLGILIFQLYPTLFSFFISFTFAPIRQILIDLDKIHQAHSHCVPVFTLAF